VVESTGHPAHSSRPALGGRGDERGTERGSRAIDVSVFRSRGISSRKLGLRWGWRRKSGRGARGREVGGAGAPARRPGPSLPIRSGNIYFLRGRGGEGSPHIIPQGGRATGRVRVSEIPDFYYSRFTHPRFVRFLAWFCFGMKNALPGHLSRGYFVRATARRENMMPPPQRRGIQKPIVELAKAARARTLERPNRKYSALDPPWGRPQFTMIFT